MPSRRDHWFARSRVRANEPALAGAVRGLRETVPDRDHPEDAGDVDDAGTLRHDVGGGLSHPIGAHQVDVEHAAELLRVSRVAGIHSRTPALLTRPSTCPNSE